MMVDTDTVVSITEANQNFSKIARLADQHGQVVIMKNNAPKYLLTEFAVADQKDSVSDEELRKASDELMKWNKHIYEELAK